MTTGSFLGVKLPGRDVDHPTPSCGEVKERVELYNCSPLGLRGLFKGKLYLLLYLCTLDLIPVKLTFKYSNIPLTVPVFNHLKT
jgi:hypothetical protein